MRSLRSSHSGGGRNATGPFASQLFLPLLQQLHGLAGACGVHIDVANRVEQRMLGQLE
jgi:hypothetical protein